MALAILKSGKASPNKSLPDGSTPILMAVKMCHSATVVTALLAAGADGQTRNKAHEAPLLVAVSLTGGFCVCVDGSLTVLALKSGAVCT